MLLFSMLFNLEAIPFHSDRKGESSKFNCNRHPQATGLTCWDEMLAGSLTRAIMFRGAMRMYFSCSFLIITGTVLGEYLSRVIKQLCIHSTRGRKETGYSMSAYCAVKGALRSEKPLTTTVRPRNSVFLVSLTMPALVLLVLQCSELQYCIVAFHGWLKLKMITLEGLC